MRYGSVCSGIESATVAWHQLGWEPAFFSEIAPFPRAVLQHHYPHVPLHGDFTTIGTDEYGPIDLLVGGTPCQDFSVAGLRAGIAGDRGNLTLEFVRLLARLRPRWCVWENVPGVLSSDEGRAFGAFLGGLAELGYGFAYRVLDAQYFNLAQRRERVFVVGHLGDWRRAAAVLFEREGLLWNPAPRRETWQRPAGTLSARTEGGGYPGTDEACDGHVVPVAHGPTISPALKSRDYKGPSSDGDGDGSPLIAVTSAQVSPSLRAQAQAQAQASHRADSEVYVVNARQDPIVDSNVSQPLGAKDTGHAMAQGMGRGTPIVPMAFTCKDYGQDAGGQVAVCIPILEPGKRTGASTADVRAGLGVGADGDPMFTLQAGAQHGVAMQRETMAVRRLTPRECARLQGFPDDYLDITYRNKPAADGPKYKALGNSKAVPVVRWIGQRIQMVETEAT